MKVFQDPTVYMFSYGMNTNSTQMFLRCNQPRIVGVGLLLRHQFNFRYHADVHYTGNVNDRVHGVVWELTHDDLDRIDALEGFPRYYTREQVNIEVRKSYSVSAWVYEMGNKGPLDFPSLQYQDCVVEGYQQNRIPTDQIYDALDRVGIEQDSKEKYHV